jgi:hypothetical protein
VSSPHLRPNRNAVNRNQAWFSANRNGIPRQRVTGAQDLAGQHAASALQSALESCVLHGIGVGITARDSLLRLTEFPVNDVNSDNAGMNFRHVRYFIAAAEEQHFCRAAKRVGIEQSPLSRAISALERDIGVRLLERSTRGSKTTPAGQIFLEHARSIIAAVDLAILAANAEPRPETL